MKSLFDGQIDHARSAGLELDQVNLNEPRALIIEDFGTCGLTGAIEVKDEGNFTDFWRRHGRSHKTGTSRGRWGLGKLVYSSSSMLSAFFGVTVRRGESQRHLMGQTVLDIHSYEGVEYPAHAFFSDLKGARPEDQIQIPVRDAAFVNMFCKNFRLERADRPGLSIVIPMPNAELNANAMISVGIANYFYPIIANQLVLDFDGQEVRRDNIRELALTHADGKISDIEKLFDFINEVNDMPKETLLTLKESWVDDSRLGENDFEPDDLAKIRELFEQRKTVGIRLPLDIKRKDGTLSKTGFSVFVKRPEDLTKGQDLYVRGGITLPGEAKFRERKAFGAMIAEEEPIAAFLGDAENAAHTRWNSRAEKLRKNFVNPQARLQMIRNSVLSFYDLLAQALEEEDERALMSFFWTELPEKPDRKKPGLVTPPIIPTPPEPKPRPIRIERIDGGFSLRPDQGVGKVAFPLRCAVKAAYDTVSGNPFKRYEPLDFDFTKRGGPDVMVSVGAVEIVEKKSNELILEIRDTSFRVDVTGFDPNRDLQVRLRTLEDGNADIQ
jgi:hypothetical protein